MSDSQRFPVAAHALAYMAHKGAFGPAPAMPSGVLASSIPTNPVVVRRVTALLAKAGLIATRPGATGGSWLLRQPEDIRLDQVLKAVNGCAHIGSPPRRRQGLPDQRTYPAPGRQGPDRCRRGRDRGFVQDHHRRSSGRKPDRAGGLCAAQVLPRRGLIAP